MSKPSRAIRKAAILVSSLDDLAAEALLAQMGEETASRVRRALVELSDIPLAEQKAVLAEFLARQRADADDDTPADNGVEVELSTGVPATGNPTAVSESTEAMDSAAADADQSFRFLELYAPGLVARILEREGAQIIAAVFAQLNPQLAARILEELPASLATESLERMAWLGEPSPEALADVADQLRRVLAAQSSLEPTASQDSFDRPLAALHALLAEMNPAARDNVLDGLKRRNVRLAEELGHQTHCDVAQHLQYRIEPLGMSSPQVAVERGTGRGPLVEFEDLLTLSDRSLRRVFAAASPSLVLLALTGAPESLLTRILKQLSTAEAATLRRRLSCPGPVRLADIATAQEELAEIARRLAEAGAIVLPHSRHFAAAA